MFHNSRNGLRFYAQMFVAMAVSMAETVRDFVSVWYTEGEYDMSISWQAFRISGIDDIVYMELAPTGQYPKEMTGRRDEYPSMLVSAVDAQSLVVVFDESGRRVDSVTMEYSSNPKYLVTTKICYAVEVTSREHVYVTRFDLKQHRWKTNRWDPDSEEEVRYHVQEEGQEYFLAIDKLINDTSGMHRLRELCATREVYAAIMNYFRSEEVVLFREAVEEERGKEAAHQEAQRRTYDDRAHVQQLVKGGMDRELADRQVKGDLRVNGDNDLQQAKPQVTFLPPDSKRWTKCTCGCSVKLTSSEYTAWKDGDQIKLICSNGHHGVVSLPESP